MATPEPPVDPSGPLGWLDELVAPTPQAPLGAADPAHLANGLVVPRSAPPVAGAGRFTVDLARAPEAIRHLEEAKHQLVDLRREALMLGKVDPPAADSVSRDAAAVISAVATGGAGSFVNAVDAGIRRLDDIITAVEADLESYRGTEQTNVGQLS